jgi:hypothetical protein
MANKIAHFQIFRRAKSIAGAFAISVVTLTSALSEATQIQVDSSVVGGITISRLGIHSAGFAQVDFAEAPAASRSCTNGIYYLNINVTTTVDNTARRMMYNTLLAAQLAGKKVRYVYVDKDDVNANCLLTVLELAP